MKRILAILLLVGIGAAAIGIMITHRQQAQRAAEQAAWEKMKAERAAELARGSKPAPPPQTMTVAPIAPENENRTPPTSAPPSAPANLNPPTTAKAPAAAPPASNPYQPKPSKKQWQDPLAREALSYVGFDAEAEEVWADAINNPDLPPNERKDLIEDLNEDGFPDPKNITEEDLPLIISRLRLIEAHGDYAMDDINAAAFREAYKDLVQMYLRLVSR